MSYLKLAAIHVCLISISWSCAPPTSFPPPIPSPSQDWSMILTQSGGFAGVNLRVRLDSTGAMTATDMRGGREAKKPLSEADLQELNRLLTDLRIPDSGGRIPMCADCFLFDLQITRRGQTISWRGDDATLGTSGAEDLIQLLSRLRDGALSGAN